MHAINGKLHRKCIAMSRESTKQDIYQYQGHCEQRGIASGAKLVGSSHGFTWAIVAPHMEGISSFPVAYPRNVQTLMQQGRRCWRQPLQVRWSFHCFSSVHQPTVAFGPAWKKAPTMIYFLLLYPCDGRREQMSQLTFVKVPMLTSALN